MGGWCEINNLFNVQVSFFLFFAPGLILCVQVTIPMATWNGNPMCAMVAGITR